MKKLFLLFLLSSCIIILPPFTTNDLYQENKEKLLADYKVRFIEITAQDLIASGAKEILLFANWCPVCYDYISNLTADQKTGVKFVSSNYSLDHLNKKYPLDTIYLLSNNHYGPVQNDKIDKFVTELLKAENDNLSVPQRFILKDSAYHRIPLYSKL